MNPIVVDTEPDTPPANSVGAPTTTPPNDVIFKDGLYFNNAGPKRRVSDRLKYIAAVEGGQPQGLRGEYALLQLLRKLPLSSKYDPVDGHILTVIYVPPIYLPVDVEVLGVAGYAEAPFSWAQDASALGGMSSIESVGQAAVVFVGPGGDYGAPKNRVLSHEIGHVLTNSGHEQKEATLIVYPASGADNDDLLTSGRRRIPGQTAVTATKCRVAGYAGEAAEMVWTESGNIILTFSGTNSDCRPTSH
jgi:hypothetical protein